MQTNSQQKFINVIYLNLNFKTSTNQYFNERIIFVVTNFDVSHINEICISKLRDSIYLKHNMNTLVNSELKNEFDNECFHYYKKISLFSHILRLKVDMSIMILRNLKLFIKYNDIRARITRIDNHIIEIEIIDDKRENTKIVISRISLQSKNDKFNKNCRTIVFCQFIKRQYFIRFAFAMIINKSQNQSLQYVDVDIQMRDCFNHEQFYVIVFKITKMQNFHFIVSELNVLSDGFTKSIKNVQ